MSEFLGKGDKSRPYSTTREERNLRDALAWGKITFDEYEHKYNILLKQGKIRRDGRIINGK